MLFLIGIILIGVGLPANPQTRSELEPPTGLAVAIVGAVVAILRHSEKNRQDHSS